MQKLEKRLSALEAARPVLGELTIIRRIVRPGELDARLCAIQDGAGARWTRLDGESDSDLMARATNEVQRNPAGVARLIECTEASYAPN